MKRLTKDERTGATAIALVALLICGGSMLLKRMEKRVHASPEVIRSIILASDSLEKRSQEDGDALEERGKDKGAKEQLKKHGLKEKKNKKGKQGDKKREKARQSPRDFLSDPL